MYCTITCVLCNYVCTVQLRLSGAAAAPGHLLDHLARVDVAPSHRQEVDLKRDVKEIKGFAWKAPHPPSRLKVRVGSTTTFSGGGFCRERGWVSSGRWGVALGVRAAGGEISPGVRSDGVAGGAVGAH